LSSNGTFEDLGLVCFGLEHLSDFCWMWCRRTYI
jgi:hypothetical protein